MGRRASAFVLVCAGPGPARSDQLGAWLVSAAEGPVARLRIARDEAGRDLVPTAEEARETAERENARLRDELERLRRQ